MTTEPMTTDSPETAAEVGVDVQRLVCCSICERQFPRHELKEADDFDPQGNHRYLNICGECEDDFDSVDITFNFKANRGSEAAEG